MGGVLIIIGGIVMLVGGIMILIEAFKESIWWGLGSLLVPFVSLAFVIVHWQAAKKPFFIWLAGLPFYIVGMILSANQMQMG